MSGKNPADSDRLTILDELARAVRAMGSALASFFLGAEPECRAKLAAVYRRGDDFLVHSQSRTTTGLWINSDPYVRLSTDCSDAELGEAVTSALDESKSGVRHPSPSNWGPRLKPLLKVARVRSWRAFVAGATTVEVEQEDGVLGFTPYENLGAQEGFRPDNANRLCLTLPASAEAVGAQVRQAIELSR